MQPQHERKSIQVFYRIDCRPPVPDISAWILLYVSFENPEQYSACGHVLKDDDGSPFGLNLIWADGKTPYEAVQSLKTALSSAPIDQDLTQDKYGLIKEAIDKDLIFTPTIPLHEREFKYAPLPSLVLVHEDFETIITSDSIVPAEIACKITGSQELTATCYRVGDLLR